MHNNPPYIIFLFLGVLSIAASLHSAAAEATFDPVAYITNLKLPDNLVATLHKEHNAQVRLNRVQFGKATALGTIGVAASVPLLRTALQQRKRMTGLEPAAIGAVLLPLAKPALGFGLAAYILHRINKLIGASYELEKQKAIEKYRTTVETYCKTEIKKAFEERAKDLERFSGDMNKIQKEMADLERSMETELKESSRAHTKKAEDLAKKQIELERITTEIRHYIDTHVTPTLQENAAATKTIRSDAAATFAQFQRDLENVGTDVHSMKDTQTEMKSKISAILPALANVTSIVRGLDTRHRQELLTLRGLSPTRGPAAPASPTSPSAA